MVNVVVTQSILNLLSGTAPTRKILQTRSGPAMLNSVISRSTTRAVSMVLGSYGVFCVYASFIKPWAGADAIILLGAATALVYFSDN
jgi:hypothetical protein